VDDCATAIPDPAAKAIKQIAVLRIFPKQALFIWSPEVFPVFGNGFVPAEYAVCIIVTAAGYKLVTAVGPWVERAVG
jgi:hypothetical protein